MGFLIILLTLAIITISYAATSKLTVNTGKESLAEHSTVIIDVMAYIIVALCTGLVGLVLWNILDMKKTIRANHQETKQEMRKYVKIQVHNAICKHQIDVEPE